MKLISIILLLFILFCFSIKGQENDSLKYKPLQPEEFLVKILHEKNAVLIDVRTFDEFRKVRLQKSVNIPVSDDFTRLADTLNKETPIFLYCSRGVRSIKAAVKLYDLGFRNLYSLRGGIENWKNVRLPVIRYRIKLE